MDDAAGIIATAALAALGSFTAGHTFGFWRGKGRVTCPLCHGSGSVPAYGPTINSEKEVFDAGFRAGVQEARADAPPSEGGES